MGRPTDWHLLDLEKDPTPGEPWAIRDLGRDFRAFAGDVGSARARMLGIAEDPVVREWTGLAAQRFRAHIAKLPDQMEKLRESHRMAGDALCRFAEVVERTQAAADGALAKARMLRGELVRAQGDLGRAEDHAARAAGAGDWLTAATPRSDIPPPDPGQVRRAVRDARYADLRRGDLESQVAGLRAQLADLRQLAEQAALEWGTAADVCGRDLDDASAAGIRNGSWQGDGDQAAAAWDTFVMVADYGVKIGSVLLFLGGPALALVVLAAALVVLADTIRRFSQGKAGWGDLLFAVLDCVPVVGRLATLVKAGQFLRGAGLALHLVRMERRLAGVISISRVGSGLQGGKGVAFGLGKDIVKDGFKDALNGGWSEVQENFVRNVVGNAVAAGGGALVEKGFHKLPGRLHDDAADIASAGHSRLPELAKHFNEETDLGRAVVGVSSTVVSEVSKGVSEDALEGPLTDAVQPVRIPGTQPGALPGATPQGAVQSPAASGASGGR